MAGSQQLKLLTLDPLTTGGAGHTSASSSCPLSVTLLASGTSGDSLIFATRMEEVRSDLYGQISDHVKMLAASCSLKRKKHFPYYKKDPVKE